MQNNDSVSKLDRAIREVIQPEPSDTMDDLSKRRLFDTVLREVAAGAPELKTAPRRRGWTLGVFGAAAAAALVFSVWATDIFQGDIGTARTANGRPEGDIPRSAVQAAAETLHPVDSLQFGALRAQDDGAIRAGSQRIVVMLPTEIEILLEPRTEIEMGPPDTSEMSVLLRRGKVLASVNPKRHGPPFSLMTKDGSVRVKGTIFSVETAATGTTVVVLRGKVETHGTSGEVAMVGAGFSLCIGETVPVPTTEKDQVVLSRDVADLAELGRHEESRVDLSERVRSTQTVQKERVALASDLLKEARRLCIERRWQEAATAYESLIHAHPTDAASVAALVSLGDLYLRRMGKPAAALISYNRYLDSQNPVLRQEAMLGKAAAHKSLGDSAQEENTLRTYLSQYPTSLQAGESRRRLAELEAVSKK